MVDRLLRILKNKYSLIFFLWIILTAVNIDKAFHIDDTFHLEVSKCIKDNPLKPMSGLINWYNIPEAIYNYNQPSLFFYLIALITKIFGDKEIPLHLFLSVFTFFSLYYFYKTAQTLLVKNINVLLVLFAFCPALMINQNVMTDVPVLSLILGFVYFLLKANSAKKLPYYCISSLLLGFGLLIKYSLLPLLVVFILVILIRRDYKNLFFLLVPLGILSLWSIWNYAEYGSIHILNRQGGEIQFNKFLAFMGCLGSISVFSISFVFGLYPSKGLKWIIYFILIAFIISIILFVFNFIPEKKYAAFLNYSFIINGFVIFILLFFANIINLKKIGFRNFVEADNFVVFLLFVIISAFIIFFAPYIATRHILLVIPFVLYLSHEFIGRATQNINKLTITIAILLGLVLAVSDWKYADYYRKMASEINLPENGNVWTAGHWGWQWYSTKKGMIQYDMNQPNVKDGDYLIYPKGISVQKFNENIKLIVVDKKWKEADMLTFFSGNSFASLYNSFIDKGPWSLSKEPIDTIMICKIRLYGSQSNNEIYAYLSKKIQNSALTKYIYNIDDPSKITRNKDFSAIQINSKRDIAKLILLLENSKEDSLFYAQINKIKFPEIKEIISDYYRNTIREDDLGNSFSIYATKQVKGNSAYSLVSYNNFETDNINWTKKNDEVDSTDAYSGKKCVRLDSSHIYSPVFSGKRSIITNSNNCIIRVSLYAKFDQIAEPIIVFSIRRGKKNIVWQGENMNNYCQDSQQWNKAYLVAEIGSNIKPDDIIEIYVWNNSKKVLRIDDFKIERRDKFR
jgi:hypothetical protein